MLSTEWEDVVHPPTQQTQSKSTSAVSILVGNELQIPRRQSPLIPISVNHLLKCDVDDSGRVLVYNNATSIICIVGRLFSVETKANCSYFSIHDGTAGIVARYWSFDTDNTNQLLFGTSWTPEPRVDHYVRVIGIAKKYKTGLSINVQHIDAISSYDALLVHWLEVIQTARALSVQQAPRAVNPQTLRSVVPPESHRSVCKACSSAAVSGRDPVGRGLQRGAADGDAEEGAEGDSTIRLGVDRGREHADDSPERETASLE